MDPKDNLPNRVEYVEAEPIERPESVEYFDRGTASEQSQTVFIQSSNGPNCCGGCGCLVAALILLALYNGGALFSGLLVVVATIISTTWLMRLSGISSSMRGYGYLVAPVFLLVMNLMAKLLQGDFIFTMGQYVAISFGTMVVLYFISLTLKQRLKL